MSASINTKAKHYDVIIIGGGLVGASLACALRTSASATLSIAVIEPFSMQDNQQPCYDDRTVALSYGSRKIFDTMGVWPALAEQAEAIRHIHISDRGHFGVTRLHSDEEGVEALGYVLENRAIGQALYAQMAAQDNIRLYCPASLSRFNQDAQGVQVRLDTETGAVDLTADLLVAADGQQSQIKQLLHIGDSRQDYNQTALVTNVTPGQPHANVAYERFTPNGPLAFLPMRNNRCSVVWTLPHKQAEKMLALDDTAFLARLQQAFGYRLGEFKKAGKRQI
ncbi:MAG TPA: 2-octaprenyl-6-methoxyphenyl hydroxylase, partial [Thiotrichales bacterium]|nr:2-octaprenyl-6-methoxyphenyl hydroxylase [Thiotrichales bacterium]